MNETSSFTLSTLIATLIVFVLILWNQSIEISEKTARGFYLLCIFLSFMALTQVILSISGIRPTNQAYNVFRRALFYAGWPIIGTGVSSAILSLLNILWPFKRWKNSEAIRSFIRSQYLLKGVCFSISVSFFGIEIGKSAHDSEMRQFFSESGYAIWFMYIIMALEILGAIGLFISEVIIPSAFGLAIIMFGAIYTHYHNGDPFSDSLDALRLLVLLICVIMIKLFSGKASTRSSSKPE